MIDFSNKETRDKLHCIALSNCSIYPLTDFHSLSMKQQRIANEVINDYIQKLPKINWISKLNEDFNRVCQEDIFNNNKIDYTSVSFKQKPIEDFPVIETEKMKILS